MSSRTVHISMALGALVLSAASFLVVYQSAADEPYTQYRPSDAIVQIGVATLLMLAWILVAAMIVVGHRRSTILRYWQPILLWILIVEFYLWHCPWGYVHDIARYTSERF